MKLSLRNSVIPDYRMKNENVKFLLFMQVFVGTHFQLRNVNVS